MTTFSDHEISKNMKAGKLVIDGSTDQLGPASYELRMGTVYYDLTESDDPIDVNKFGTVLIKPGHRVVLITLEKLEIPNNVIARIVSKGSFFSLGLSAVCTYADPGFDGHIGIVTHNISNKYIEIPIGQSIAKVDFSKLDASVAKPYKGQHGFHTKVWPVRHDLQKEYSEVAHDDRVQSEKEEALKLLPYSTNVLLKRLEKKQRVSDRIIILVVILNAMAFVAVYYTDIDALTAMFSNLFVSLVAGIILTFWKFED